MRKLLACAATLALLTACGETDEEPAAEAPPLETTTPASAQDLVGTWTYTWPDGVQGTSTVNPDGTHSREMADGSTFTGTWEMVGEEACFSDAGTQEPRCYDVGGAAPDGSRVLTRSDGELITVVPVVEDAPAG